MKLHYVSREQYRKKSEFQFADYLHEQFGDFYLIPEGGTNEAAVKGVTEFAETLGDDFDYLCCSVGTGGTLAGIINGLHGHKSVLGFSALKGGEFLQTSVELYLNHVQNHCWKIVTDYHFGGYGKMSGALKKFEMDFERNHSIPLDPVYTLKMMAGIFNLVQKGFFKTGSTILALHSGGLQGKMPA